MTENERRILVEFMELMIRHAERGSHQPRNMEKYERDNERLRQLTAQLRDADKPAGGEG